MASNETTDEAENSPESNPIASIDESTRNENEQYLDALGWDENPFARPAKPSEYVIPSEGSIGDVTDHIRNYTGPILIHSRFSGVGKTTLLDVLLNAYEDEFATARVAEHNLSEYELACIVAESLHIPKSSSTKLTERRVKNQLADCDRPILIGIDEFGLNKVETLHVVQYLNDLPKTRIVLTGMTSQWEAVGGLGSDGRAFGRRFSHRQELEPFEIEQTRELITRRIATATNRDPDGWDSLDTTPFFNGAIEEIHTRSRGVPGVISAAASSLLGLAAYRYDVTGEKMIDRDFAGSEAVEYADPRADIDTDEYGSVANDAEDSEADE